MMVTIIIGLIIAVYVLFFLVCSLIVHRLHHRILELEAEVSSLQKSRDCHEFAIRDREGFE